MSVVIARNYYPKSATQGKLVCMEQEALERSFPGTPVQP